MRCQRNDLDVVTTTADGDVDDFDEVDEDDKDAMKIDSDVDDDVDGDDKHTRTSVHTSSSVK